MSEPFIGQIQTFGFNFAPRGWALCDGQLLPIPQFSALFSLLGTTYGGDGRTTFGLPDLRGRVALHQGQGAGLSDRRLGQKGGTEDVTLAASQLPGHSHPLNAVAAEATSFKPAGNLLAAEVIYGPGPSDTMLAADAIGDTGGDQPHNNMQPYLVINWCIALTGVFPSRN